MLVNAPNPTCCSNPEVTGLCSRCAALLLTNNVSRPEPLPYIDWDAVYNEGSATASTTEQQQQQSQPVENRDDDKPTPLGLPQWDFGGVDR